jgi:tRNA(Ile)-lysidine synthase
VAAVLRSVVEPGAHLVVGLSGGVDSVTLLALLAELAAGMQFSLRALHVHHGISPNASSWGRFCQELCGRLKVPLRIEHVQVGEHRSHGLEGAARRARYAAYAREEGDFIVLAHHRDDQAETLLLQLLRGAGTLGLAGMPELRALEGTRARILRPLLAFPRTDIESWARQHGLRWIEDESNDDIARQRNFIRHRALPAIEEQFPAARVTIARAAAHLAEAGDLLTELARLDLAALDGPGGIDVAGLRRLGAMRARNALRTLLRLHAIPAPASARLDELYRQLVDSREDRTVLLSIAGWDLRRYRGRLIVERGRTAAPADFRETWHGESSLPVLELGGVLKFKAEEGRGLSVRRLRAAEVTVRLRKGGERLRPAAKRPRRELKKLLQERGIPPWRRARWPVIYCGEDLVCVPGIGDDCDWQAGPGEPGLILTWEPLD